MLCSFTLFFVRTVCSSVPPSLLLVLNLAFVVSSRACRHRASTKHRQRLSIRCGFRSPTNRNLTRRKTSTALAGGALLHNFCSNVAKSHAFVCRYGFQPCPDHPQHVRVCPNFAQLQFKHPSEATHRPPQAEVDATTAWCVLILCARLAGSLCLLLQGSQTHDGSLRRSRVHEHLPHNHQQVWFVFERMLIADNCVATRTSCWIIRRTQFQAGRTSLSSPLVGASYFSIPSFMHDPNLCFSQAGR